MANRSAEKEAIVLGEVAKLDSELARGFARATPMHHTGHDCTGVDPGAIRQAEGHEHCFAGEHRVRGPYECSPGGQVLDAIGDELEIAFPHDLTLQSE